jgi:hypothetical protein
VRRVIIGLAFSMTVLAAACGSGPSEAALALNQLPSTTTTTQPPPEGVVVVHISNGAFQPANLQIDLDTFWIVEWRNDDAPREYQVTSRDAGLFESPILMPGDSFQVDFSQFEPALYRYNTFLGNQRIPGLVDTRPAR